MYEYKFEKLLLSTIKSEPFDDYHEIIHKHAEEGWKLVQIFSPSIRSSGQPQYFEIIFEREKKE